MAELRILHKHLLSRWYTMPNSDNNNNELFLGVVDQQRR